MIINDKYLLSKNLDGKSLLGEVIFVPFKESKITQYPFDLSDKDHNEAVEIEKVISYGLNPMGYDLRLSDEFLVPNENDFILDPKDQDLRSKFHTVYKREYIIQPHSFILGRSLEYINMPVDTIGICLGKSTYARCGILVNVTPLEPEWKGYLTIEISNTTKHQAKLYAYEGICQVLLFKSDIPCINQYYGKYQNSLSIDVAKL